MKRKNKTVVFMVTDLIFLIFLSLPSILFAQVYDNIGFKKDVPEEIRKACPMCDEFLDVKWIDEKRNIGKLKAEVYRNGKRSGPLYFLVRLENPREENILYRGNGITYKITEKEYQSKEFETLIKEADYLYNKGFLFMDAYVKGKIVREFTQGPIPSGLSMESYSSFSKTVCVLYYEGDYTFVAETKKPFLKPNLSKELKEKYDVIVKYANGEISKVSAQGAQIGYIKYCDTIDVNFDGLDDYIFGFNIGNVPQSRRVVIYFSKNHKYEFKDITNCIPGMNVYYKPIDKMQLHFGKCNLTELIRGGN